MFGNLRSFSHENGRFTITNAPAVLPVRVSVSHAGYESLIFEFQTIDNQPISITLKKLPLASQSPVQADNNANKQDPVTGQQPYGSEMEIYLERFKWVVAATLLLPFIFFGAWWIRRAYHLRRLQLIKQGSDEEFSDYSLLVKGGTNKLFRGQVFRRIAQEMRQHRRLNSNEIDPALTVNATVRKGGWFTPVYALRREQPEYMALIDRANVDDHQALLQDALISRFAEEGVIVEQYFFHGSPLVCRKKAPREEYFDLQELMAIYPNRFLLIFSEGDGLINTLTGEPQRWLHMLRSWSVCALLTPKEPADWGYQERALSEQGLVVVPANKHGIASLVEAIYDGKAPNLAANNTAAPFPELLYERPGRWLERHEPERAVANKLCFQLRRFLGDEGYYLLGACAVYPVLYWKLTILLAYKLDGSDGLEERLRLLARLPWFRYGSMPDSVADATYFRAAKRI